MAAVHQSGRARLGLAQYARRQARRRDDLELVGGRSRRHGPQTRGRARQRAWNLRNPRRRPRPASGSAADDLGRRRRNVHRPRFQGRRAKRDDGPHPDQAHLCRQSDVRDPGHDAASHRRWSNTSPSERKRRRAGRSPEPGALAQAGRPADRPRDGQGTGRGRSHARSEARQDRQARGLAVPCDRSAVEPDARQVRRAGEARPGRPHLRRRSQYPDHERRRPAVRRARPHRRVPRAGRRGPGDRDRDA